MNPWLSVFLPIGATVVIGVIGYFLKRSVFGRVNEIDQNVKEIRQCYTPLAVHDKAFDECRNDIKQIKEDYITRDDFFREQSKTDRKLDRIMDILLEMKGEKHGE